MGFLDLRICVLGAGLIGVSSAYFLAKSGNEVTVIDRQSGPGLETSFANGGQLSASQSAPWASPKNLQLVLTSLGKKDSPLLYKIRSDPQLWSWSIRFLMQCSNKKQIANTISNLKIAIYNREVLKSIQKNIEIEYDFKSLGILQLIRNIKTMEGKISDSQFLEDMGCKNQILSRESCLKLEPALKDNYSQIIGGISIPSDASGDAHKFTRGLEAECKKLGVKFKYNEEITHIKVDNNKIEAVITNENENKADCFLMSLGSYLPNLVKSINLKVPIYPIKGYSITVPVGRSDKAPHISLTDEDNKIVYSRLGERLRVAGTAEFNGYDKTIRKDRIQPLINNARKQFPNAGEYTDALPWIGLRPATPDGVPIIDKTPIEKLYINSGHGHLGWTMAMASAKMISDVINHKKTDIDISNYSLNRFNS